ncbi:MAG: AAA family ATPase [Acidobacteriota bacterium]|nr:AAA family ATPase [Acidobacteriota bacterium]
MAGLRAGAVARERGRGPTAADRKLSRPRGEFRLGIQYAQRLVAIDPFSEDAHQKLMQLYSLSERRSRALAQYVELKRALKRELDAEPLEETARLKQRILQQSTSTPYVEGSGEAIGPMIPMAGRREEYERLGRGMESALAGEGLRTIVAGEPGVGKTRLIRSFLDGASSQGHTVVLKGSCLDVLPESFQPLARALRGAFSTGSELGPETLTTLDDDTRFHLSTIVPEFADGVPARRGRAPSTDTERKRVFEAVEKTLTTLCGLPGGKMRRIVVLLDDLQRADPATLKLLRHLHQSLRPFPVWIVCACARERLNPNHQLHGLVDDPATNCIRLGRLDSDSVYEVAASLVPQGQANELAPSSTATHGACPTCSPSASTFCATRACSSQTPVVGLWRNRWPTSRSSSRTSSRSSLAATNTCHIPRAD